MVSPKVDPAAKAQNRMSTNEATSDSADVAQPQKILRDEDERSCMKPVLRYQSQWLFRRSYKPNRVLRIRPSRRLNWVFRPMKRFGAKPELTIVS